MVVQIDRYMVEQVDRYMVVQIDRYMVLQIDRYVYGCIDRQIYNDMIDIQLWIDKQFYRFTDKQFIDYNQKNVSAFFKCCLIN